MSYHRLQQRRQATDGHRRTDPAPSAIRRIDSPRMGLIAGWGRYPVVVADSLTRMGFRVYCLGVKEHADPRLNEICADFEWIGLAQLGKAIRYFNRHGVRRATMAGKVHKIKLLRPWSAIKHVPDWRAIRRFYPHFLLTRKDRKDDTLLLALVDEFAVDGIEFAPATDFMPELLVNAGPLTRRRPTAAQAKDIEFGWELAIAMGRLDVGQSVCVRHRAALAVEAIEGTDECIRRAGALAGGGGFTVVKVAKPQQDMRFDVPTVGLLTVQAMVDAGAAVLAIEAGRTIVLDEAHVIEFADRHRLAIVALEKPNAGADAGSAAIVAAAAQTVENTPRAKGAA